MSAVARTSRVRLLVLHLVVLALVTTLLGRLWWLQVASGQTLRQVANGVDVREVATPALRGLILDDRGRPLAADRTALVVSVDTQALREQADGGRAVLHRLATVLGEPYAHLRARLLPCGSPGALPAPTCWSGSPLQPVPVTSERQTRLALRVMERRERFPGVHAAAQAVRTYPAPDGVNAAQLLGYLSPVTADELTTPGDDQRSLERSDLVGRSGLERAYDGWLRGRAGVRRLAVDHVGRVVGTVGHRAPRPGDHVVTSIDARLQGVVERQLRAAIDRARHTPDPATGRRTYAADSGSAVVLDVRTGRVLAMASYPTYDPTVWVGGISRADYRRLTSPAAGTPQIFRATQGQFPAASTFKIVSTSAADAAGFPLHGTYDCPSSLRVGDRRFGNFESRGYGPISLTRAIEVSCDTVFYRLAYRMWQRDGGNSPRPHPRDLVLRMAKAFGFGHPTGIDLPAESGGRVVDRTYKQVTWQETRDALCRRARTGYPEVASTDRARARYLRAIARENCADGFRYRAGDAVNVAIGQGDTSVTPLQIARAYAAVANGGTLWSPRVAKAIVATDGHVVRRIRPRVERHLPVPARTLAFLRRALRGVAENGTASSVFAGWPMRRIPMAAKTGTGEVFGKQTTSVFASFAPADAPRYAVVMSVAQGGTGSGTSGPSVRRIYERIFGVHGSVVVPGTALLPGGPPSTLPVVHQDGRITPPAGRGMASR